MRWSLSGIEVTILFLLCLLQETFGLWIALYQLFAPQTECQNPHAIGFDLLHVTVVDGVDDIDESEVHEIAVSFSIDPI